MWTANEEALTCDGPISAYGQTTTVRLCKFTRTTVHDAWTPAGQFPYTTEPWERQYNYSSKARHGVADLCALPDGSLLVLERDLSFSSTSEIGIAFGGSWLGWGIYRVATPEWATDVTDDIYTAGIRPDGEEPLKITAISTEGGKLSLEFNAIKVAPDSVYHVMGGSALGQGTMDFSELMSGTSQFDEDRQEWRTIWTGDFPSGQESSGFYFIRATRTGR